MSGINKSIQQNSSDFLGISLIHKAISYNLSFFTPAQIYASFPNFQFVWLTAKKFSIMHQVI